MSVKTTADESLGNAKNSVNAAIKQLAKIVIDECEGVEEFNDLYVEEIHRALDLLLIVRIKLR